MPRRKLWIVSAAILVLVASLALSACGDSSDSSSTTDTSASSESGSEDGSSGGGASLEAAETQVEEAYGARYTEPPSKSVPAAKEKDVWMISPGNASPNSAAFYFAAKEAAAKIGWKLTLFDGKLDPSKPPEGIRQAVASGADGIIVIAIDCAPAKSAYEVAKEADVKVVPLVAFDCSESEPGGDTLFSAPISLGDRYQSWTEAYESWGSDLAAWAITDANGEANTINTTNDQYKIITDTEDGFASRMAECEECENTEMPWVVEEAGAKLAAKVQAEILRNPEATALNNSINPGLGIAQGIVQSGKAAEIAGVGGYGLPEDIVMVQEGNKGLKAVAAWPLKWWSWAAVDTLNSIFAGEEPEDSGLGWQMIDADHNLPKGEEFVPTVDFEADYAKRWGK